jgi:hypothetical protein
MMSENESRMRTTYIDGEWGHQDHIFPQLADDKPEFPRPLGKRNRRSNPPPPDTSEWRNPLNITNINTATGVFGAKVTQFYRDSCLPPDAIYSSSRLDRDSLFGPSAAGLYHFANDEGCGNYRWSKSMLQLRKLSVIAMVKIALSMCPLPDDPHKINAYNIMLHMGYLFFQPNMDGNPPFEVISITSIPNTERLKIITIDDAEGVSKRWKRIIKTINRTRTTIWNQAELLLNKHFFTVKIFGPNFIEFIKNYPLAVKYTITRETFDMGPTSPFSVRECGLQPLKGSTLLHLLKNTSELSSPLHSDRSSKDAALILAARHGNMSIANASRSHRNGYITWEKFVKDTCVILDEYDLAGLPSYHWPFSKDDTCNHADITGEFEDEIMFRYYGRQAFPFTPEPCYDLHLMTFQELPDAAFKRHEDSGDL